MSGERPVPASQRVEGRELPVTMYRCVTRGSLAGRASVSPHADRTPGREVEIELRWVDDLTCDELNLSPDVARSLGEQLIDAADAVEE